MIEKYRQVKKNVFASFFIIISLFASNQVLAQFQEIEVGINGLTCSMCSYSVENSIKKLPYVNIVKMDLNKNIAQVISDRGNSIDFKEVTERVKKSGFSVRFLSFKLPTDVIPNSEGMFKLNDRMFYIIYSDSKTLKAGATLKLVGEGYLPKTDLKKHLAKLSSEQKKILNEGQAFFVIHED
jgi:copper chaperone CopZ